MPPQPPVPDYTPYLITIISKLDEIIEMIQNLPSGATVVVNVPGVDMEELHKILGTMSEDYRKIHGIC